MSSLRVLRWLRLAYLGSALAASACGWKVDPSGADVSVAAGGINTCALAGGKVWCWGGNEFGQVGINTSGSGAYVSTPQQIGLTNAQSVAVGVGAACAVANGALWCWGYDQVGALGTASPTSVLAPTRMPSLTSGVQAVAVGSASACAVTSSGLACWGKNTHGELGNGTTTDSRTPVGVPALTSAVQSVSVGYGFACAVANAKAWCWGYNASGQLGNGTTTDSATPVQVASLSTGVRAIAAGGRHACALVTDGVKCWGYNRMGELGNGSITDSSVPVAVKWVKNTDSVQQLAVGDSHTCAVVNGAAVCWGENAYAQLGRNAQSPQPGDGGTVYTLTSNVSQVAAGRAHACAARDGGVWCWGARWFASPCTCTGEACTAQGCGAQSSNAGVLGTGSTTGSVAPVHVFDP